MRYNMQASALYSKTIFLDNSHEFRMLPRFIIQRDLVEKLDVRVALFMPDSGRFGKFFVKETNGAAWAGAGGDGIKMLWILASTRQIRSITDGFANGNEPALTFSAEPLFFHKFQAV